MGQSGKALLLMLWKNIILQIRRPVGTAVELLSPILVIAILIFLRLGQFPPEDVCFSSYDDDPLTISQPQISYTIVYTPVSNNSDSIAEIVKRKLPFASVVGVESESELESSLLDVQPPITISTIINGVQVDNEAGCLLAGAGIVFDELETSQLEFTLRLRHEVNPSGSWGTGSRVASNFPVEQPSLVPNLYLQEGFLHLQKLVEEAIIEWRTGQELEDIAVSVRQIPVPAYITTIPPQLMTTANLFIVLCYLYTTGIFVKELVLEKETRVRELLLITGLKNWVLLTAWYIKQFFFFLLISLIIAIMLKYGGIFPETDFGVLFLFLFLFSNSLVAFSILISTLFDAAQGALLGGFVLYFLNYMPYTYVMIEIYYDNLTRGDKMGLSLLSNTALGFGVQLIFTAEQAGSGVQWNTISTLPSISENIHLGHIFLMLSIDTFLYMILAWYIDAVRPRKYGVPKPLYFPFLPSYWTGRPRSVGKKADDEEMEMESLKGPEHEEEPTDLEVGVCIKNLTKIYDKSITEKLGFTSPANQHHRRTAVDQLNMNLYSGQITALLGHNGAGKTTTMSMLTGLYTPTCGTALIGGLDIRKDMVQIRQSLSICPQHNILFGRLTVAEHLILFGIFKGFTWKEVKREIDELLEDIDLLDKKDTPAGQLSGGQKRKLSVCIALIGSPKFVALDEPTSGMDPYARRATWNLLIKRKEDKTIVFSTHFMDEADILGDRIAIMAAGKLRCSGSSLFLKNRYGVGYHMVVEKAASSTPQKVTDVIGLMKSHISGAKCVLDIGLELGFVLPSEETHAFAPLFRELEARKDELGIAGFGVSVTTMEEVFLKVKDESDEHIESRVKRRGTLSQCSSNEVPNHTPNRSNSPYNTTDPSSVSVTENVGLRLWLQQYYGLLVKKTLDSVRHYPLLAAIYIIPILGSLIGLLLFVFLGNIIRDDSARLLSIGNSAACEDRVEIFWAKFDDSVNGLNFESLQAADVGATEFTNITTHVSEIMDSVQTISNVSDCCDYQNQILDKFCALRSPDELSICGSSSFGYSHCKDCLECCTSRLMADSSCTNPLTQTSTSERVCPSVPKVSLTDALSVGATGRLDSDNIFVAEYLLRYASEGLSEYQTGLMGGLTVGQEEPAYSACGCSNPSDFTQNYLAPLQQCSDLSTASERSYVVSGAFDWYNNTDCTSLVEIVGTVGSGGMIDTSTLLIPLNTSVRVDGSSLGALQGLSCSTIDVSSLGSVGESIQEGCGENSTTERPMSAYYPPQTQRTSVTVWYNGRARHMSAAMLNLYYNMQLKEVTGNNSLSISVNNHPLPRTEEGELQGLLINTNGYKIGVAVLFAFSLFLSTYILPLLKEKHTQVKHLQHISGVRSSTYWLSNMTLDYFHCVVIIPIVVALFAAFQLDDYSGENLAALAVILVTSCVSTIPLVYLFSFAFKDALIAYAVLAFLFSLLTSQVARSTLTFITSLTLMDALHFILLTIPTYGLLAGISDIYTNSILQRVCMQNTAIQQVCDSTEAVRYVDNIFSLERPGIGYNIVYGIVETILFFSLLAILEHQVLLVRLVNRVLGRKKQREVENYEPIRTYESVFNALPYLLKIEDSDVTAERKMVKNGEITDDHIVVLRNLCKIYPRHLDGLTLRPTKVAVKGLTLAIPKGECFGLLGTNGAGKTTTFRMLTGDLNPTSGSATIKGFDVVTQFKQVRQHIGYCPQFSALLERLSGRELLTVFARLRGIPENVLKTKVESEIRRLDLTEYADKQCGKYSGGNKRKLSTGIALVGNPAVIFLDEPTTGMDTATRRFLWNVLSGIIRNGQSIILTSHSMEECEALCTCIGILVNGQFKCLGSVQHVKNKYGHGVILQAKVDLKPKEPTTPKTPKSPKIFSRIFTIRRGRSSENTLPWFRSLSQNQVEGKKTNGEEEANGSHDHEAGSHDHEAVRRVTSAPTTYQASSKTKSSKKFLKTLYSLTSLLEPADDTIPDNSHDTSSLQKFLNQRYRGAILLEEHQGFVSYKLPLDNVNISGIFEDVEENKERLGITHYSISQITLEQVFINFSRKQERVFKK